jgi:Mn2+/Fe2+ NRAMP family transporter
MISMVLVAGATLYSPTDSAALTSLAQIVGALNRTESLLVSKLVVSIGITGACIVAAIVTAVCPVWGMCEYLGAERSLNRKVRDAPKFYATFTALLLASLAVACTPGLGTAPLLSIQIEILNSVLFPVVVGFLWCLSSSKKVMPERYRLKGVRRAVLGVVFLVASIFCIYATIQDVVSLV